ncbi:hypothetical protein ACSFBM_14400 [Variovorax sp. GB1R11]
MLYPARARPGRGEPEGSLLQETSIMKSIILWLCGVPLIVIIGLKIFGIL